uniref:Uncharacterized protein n=1 Tax=Chelydra serpentina TaxID=8475 RepID=A0A8C3S9S0_CHESE
GMEWKTIMFRFGFCFRTSVSSKDPDKPQADAGANPVTDAEDMDTDAAAVQSNLELPLETQPPDLHQKCWFEGLPKRLHVPAPKVLCRPASQRWIKPCCTRSCGETLETIHMQGTLPV